MNHAYTRYLIDRKVTDDKRKTQPTTLLTRNSDLNNQYCLSLSSNADAFVQHFLHLENRTKV